MRYSVDGTGLQLDLPPEMRYMGGPIVPAGLVAITVDSRWVV